MIPGRLGLTLHEERKPRASGDDPVNREDYYPVTV